MPLASENRLHSPPSSPATVPTTLHVYFN